MAYNKEKSSQDAVVDSESLNGPPELHNDARLVRQLKNRHIAMISIGGVIGTGARFSVTRRYFLQSHSTLQVFSWVLEVLCSMVGP